MSLPSWWRNKIIQRDIVNSWKKRFFWVVQVIRIKIRWYIHSPIRSSAKHQLVATYSQFTLYRNLPNITDKIYEQRMRFSCWRSNNKCCVKLYYGIPNCGEGSSNRLVRTFIDQFLYDTKIRKWIIFFISVIMTEFLAQRYIYVLTGMALTSLTKLNII